MNCWANCSTNNAMIGEKSSPPMLGMIRRNGLSTGVTIEWTAPRIV